ncbi:MAG: peptidoglycan editing factor PgeF [Prevotella sp.]|nr:peptidoglycan editing factor PgeF [Prevotella sp.]
MIEPTLHYYSLGEGVTAFSSTRQGGYSKGCYGQFNINRYCGDDEEAVRKNREALCQQLHISDDCLLMPHQVHQTKLAVVDEEMMKLPSEERSARLEGVDALMTNMTGVCIGVSTADCIPVLLFDRRYHVVCAIHAGWRGTVKRIVEKSVAKMADVYGTRPADIIAQIGPSISLDSFEVGDEVYDAFAHEGFPMETVSRKYPAVDVPSGKWHIDLPECNRRQLLATGVPAAQIAVSPVCTVKQSETFFSARRLGISSGRIFTGILLLR